MIRIANVVKYHGPNRILDGVSLEIPKGEVVGIIGPSGAGKSTLLRCINGLEQFQSGEIAIGGLALIGGPRPLGRELLLQVRRRVGMVFQQFHLFPHLSALANVMCGPVHVLGQGREEAEKSARHWLERVGLADKADARPSQLSGGQQQRVAIARALAVNPEAILFDEPTSALDPKMSAEVMRVIDDLTMDVPMRTTMVIVSHDIPALRRVADSLVVLDAGKVVYTGAADQAPQAYLE